MNSNITAYGRAEVHDVLVIRLDNSPYMLTLLGEDSIVKGCEFHGNIPTLLGWLKLWWRYRPRAKRQHSLTTCFRIM